MNPVIISWRTADGEEHEESWPTVGQFRVWAEGEGIALSYTAYQADEDGEMVIIDRGDL